MVLPLLYPKSLQLKKLIEKGHLLKAQKLIESDMSLLKYLLEFVGSDDTKLSSNSIYLLTKIFLKHKMNHKKLLPYIKKFLKSDDDEIVLNTLMCLKLLLKENPDYFKYVEKEIYEINKKSVNVLIREHTWELIKNYGDIEKLNEAQSRKNALYEKLVKLKDSIKQQALIKKLLDLGESLLNLSLVKKLEISEEKIESPIKKEDLKGTLKLIEKGKLEELNPLNVAYCFSVLINLDKKEIEKYIDNVFKLIFSDNEIIRNTALHTIYEITKKYPDLVYERISILREYCRKYGRNILVEEIFQELSKHI